MIPDQRAAWNAYAAACYEVVTREPDNAPLSHCVVAAADHLVALEAQVAEARRVMAEDVIRPYVSIDGGECLVCGWFISPLDTHAPTCRVGAFLAATAETP